MAETVLGGAIAFFERIGVYDVVLPFILVFTIMFAILERTKILGTEEIIIDGSARHFTKKNLNAMTAFVVAFFVVASSQIVGVVTKISANMVILLLLVVFVLLLVGSFYKQGSVGEDGLEKGWMRTTFMAIIGLGMLLIFLDAMTLSNGVSWLEFGYTFMVRYWNSSAVAAVMLIVLLIGFVVFVSRSPAKDDANTTGGDD